MGAIAISPDGAIAVIAKQPIAIYRESLASQLVVDRNSARLRAIQMARISDMVNG